MAEVNPYLSLADYKERSGVVQAMLEQGLGATRAKDSVLESCLRAALGWMRSQPGEIDTSKEGAEDDLAECALAAADYILLARQGENAALTVLGFSQVSTGDSSMTRSSKEREPMALRMARENFLDRYLGKGTMAAGGSAVEADTRKWGEPAELSSTAGG